MRLIATLLFPFIVLAQLAATAQSPATAKSHPAATHAAASASASASKDVCAKLPPISPKVPALPAGSSCAKTLYTLTLLAPVKIEYVSPLEGTALKDILNVPEPATFSLSYVDIKAGAGELAAPHKWYSIRYHGYLVDGTEFDASDKHGTAPFAFSIDQHQVVAGWLTGFAGMRVGGKRRLFIPPQLAYGNKGSGAVPPNSWLIFEVDFIAQSDADPTPKPAQPATSAAPNPGATPTVRIAPAQPATPPTAAPAPAPASAAPAPAPPATAPGAPAPKPQ
jgi:peptidylprolyl isomerase